MTTRRIISGSRPASLLMRRIWFNCNRVFSRFEFIFLNPRWVQDGFRMCSSIVTPSPPRPDYILKIIFYYFILYFNINNKNN